MSCFFSSGKQQDMQEEMRKLACFGGQMATFE